VIDRAIITGAAGFIGEHLSGGLVKNAIPHGAIYHTQIESDQNPLRTSFAGDLLDPRFVHEVLPGYDVVVHLAGRTGQGQLDDPSEFVRKNIETTAIVYRAAREAGTKRIILASSYEVYGVPQRVPLEESHVCLPTTPYGVTMAAREGLARTLGKAYGIKTTILRFFTVFGQPVSERNRKGAIATFVRKLQRGEELTLMGSMHSMRDYIYVADVVRCLVRCIVDPTLGDTTLNLGSGVGSSLSKIIDALKCHFPDLRSSNKPGAAGAGEYDIIASTDKIRSELGFTPQYDLASAIQEMLSPMVAE
jgi:UDP-glucose 4-epimerase